MTPALAALALALTDLDSPVWLDPALATEDVKGYLRFHCGCPLVEQPAKAAFALIGDAAALDDFGRFSLGSAEYPETSTTLFVAVASLSAGDGPRLTGPGIKDDARLSAEGLAPEFWTALRDNNALFPQGVDLVLAAPDAVAALPRSVQVEI